MGFAVACLALGHIGVLTPVAESACKCLVLGYGLFHLGANFLMTRDAEGPRSCHGVVDLQRMMCRMAAEAVTGHLTLGMGLMAHGTVRDLAVNCMTEGAGLLSMSTFIIGEILSRSLMAGKTRLFNIVGKVQGQGFMRV